MQFKKTVINNEYIFSILICQIKNAMMDDICCKKRSKTEPVCFCRIYKTVENALRKLFLKGVCSLLHIHTFSGKNTAKFETKQKNRSPLFFHSIAFGKKLTYMIFREKFLNTHQLKLFHRNGFVLY